MKRLIEQKVIDWKNSVRRKPLIIRGARQVGKTWLVENFLANHFDHFAKIDFEERQDLHEHFSGNLDPKKIVEALELSVGRIVPGKTLLFFDEIQSCPRAIMALRYFYEKMPELHVIAAGSLLEFAFGDISIPVGRVQYLYMYPMTFYEYLLATDKEPMAKLTLCHPGSLSETVQLKILEELKTFIFIGGMPECVKVYHESGSLVETFAVQREIIESYRDDFSKYRPQIDSTCIDAVFVKAAHSVGEQIKYTKMNDAHTGPTNRKAIGLLSKARIIHKIYNCSPSGLPLAVSVNASRFKVSFIDIGLMQSLCEVPISESILESDLLAIYHGKLAEQFVGQEMRTKLDSELYYWSRSAKSSNAEVDFLTTFKEKILPIEVKSGKGGSLKSLHLMLKEYPNCPEGLVLYSGPYKELKEQKLKFLPLYCAGNLEAILAET